MACRSEESSNRTDTAVESDTRHNDPPAHATRHAVASCHPTEADAPASDADCSAQAPVQVPLPLPSMPASAESSTAGTLGSVQRDKARLLECAHKLIRALCKLAMLTSTVPGDTSVTHGRALAMELLAAVLIKHGSHFVKYPKLMGVVKSELGNCLLGNSKSSSAVLQRLTCQIFVVVLKTFREELKGKVWCSPPAAGTAAALLMAPRLRHPFHWVADESPTWNRRAAHFGVLVCYFLGLIPCKQS